MQTATAVPPKGIARSEDDVLAKAPLTMKFGDAEYRVPVLRIGAAREWRQKLVEEVKSIVAEIGKDATNNEAFTQGLAFVFVKFPDKLADLVFAYGKDLPRETVENDATDEQMARAFSQIMAVAFPFAKELGTITQTFGVATSFRR